MRPRIAAVIAGVALVVTVGGAARADLTVKGDQAAWAEVTAAYRKLNALPGYRMKMTMGQGQTMLIEVAPAAGAVHSTIQLPQGSMETIVMGGQMRFRVSAQGAPGGWQCRGPAAAVPADPTKLDGTVEVGRAPDTVIDGEAVRGYAYTIEGGAGGQSLSQKSTLYVGVQSGLPRRGVFATPQGDQALDFYDYGANIQITLPPCG